MKFRYGTTVFFIIKRVHMIIMSLLFRTRVLTL